MVAGSTVQAAESVPTMSIEDTSAYERLRFEPKVPVTVRLSEPAPYRITAKVNVIDGGTATRAADFFDPGTQYVSFPAGKTVYTVWLKVRDDLEPEADETVELELHSAVGALIGDSSATITILDDDQPAQLVIEPITVIESNGFVRVPVTAVRRSAQSGSFRYELVDGTAVRGEDYVFDRGTIGWSPAQRLDSVRFKLRGDDIAEADETLTLRLFDASNVVLSTDAIEITIIDDDVPPVISVADLELDEGDDARERVPVTITLDRRYSRPVTLRVATVEGSALAGVDYLKIDKTVIVDGRTTINLPLDILGNLNPEPDEQFTIEFSTPTEGVVITTPVVTVTIHDDD
jgi:hypothetical protein